MKKKEVISLAKTIEEAIDKACNELMVSREEVSVEILEVPKKGFLGIGQVDAKVKVVSNKKDIDKLEIAKNYLWSILSNMGMENFDIDVEEKNSKKVVFTLKGDNLGIAIGKRGDTLNALQQLCSIAANMSGGGYYNVVIDVGNYRKEREQALKNLACKISNSCIRSKRSITLEPMNSYERKIIHEVVQGIDGVDSYSKGEEPYRYIVVFPVDVNCNNKKVFNKNNSKNYKHTML